MLPSSCQQASARTSQHVWSRDQLQRVTRVPPGYSGHCVMTCIVMTKLYACTIAYCLHWYYQATCCPQTNLWCSSSVKYNFYNLQCIQVKIEGLLIILYSLLKPTISLDLTMMLNTKSTVNHMTIKITFLLLIGDLLPHPTCLIIKI